MKHVILLLIFVLISPFHINAQIKVNPKSGCLFFFEDFEFTTKNVFKPIKQSEIKAVKVSLRTIKISEPANCFIFYPRERFSNKVNLIDILLWAIEKEDLPVYSAEDETEFENKSSWNEVLNHMGIKRTVNSKGDSVLSGKIKSQDVTSYLIMESTIYGKKNQILAVRPIGICPIIDVIRKNEAGEALDTAKKKLFWVYYPDVSDLLSNHFPVATFKDITSTHDFFSKQLYKGDLFTYYHSNIEAVYNWSMGDSSNQFVNNFDAAWIYKRIKSGMFVSPYNTMYQGNAEIVRDLIINEPETDPEEEDEAETNRFDPSTIACAKFRYEIINLCDTNNYPLYFPETPLRGQTSLIDLILGQVNNGTLNVYSTDVLENDFETPLSLNQIKDYMGARTDTIAVLENVTDSAGNTYEEMVNKVAETEVKSSEIKKYIIKNAELYDNNNLLIKTIPVAITPIREFFMNDYEDMEPRYRKIFTVPLEDMKQSLQTNFVYRFTANDDITFYQFLTENKYKADSVYYVQTSINQALSECKLSGNTSEKQVLGAVDTLLYSEPTAKIVFRKISVENPENSPLFLPEFRTNGLKSFIDFSILNFEQNGLQIFEYTPSGDFTTPLSIGLIDIALGAVADTMYIENIETGELIVKVVPGFRRFEEIKSYIIQEIQTGDKLLITGICPVREYITNDEASKLISNNLFWIPLTSAFRKELARQEIFRPNCEPEKTYDEFFFQRKYKGEVIEEREISAEDAKIIIDAIR